jgi:hypothetical protein
MQNEKKEEELEDFEKIGTRPLSYRSVCLAWRSITAGCRYILVPDNIA